MDRKELIKKFLEFYESKNHKIIQNKSLIPENDPTVLFTTAGMQPLVPNLLGEPHPQGKRLCNVQKCIRTIDIDEVGDTFHHTFFEMLGNWSLGDYWKKEAIEMTFEFLTKKLRIPIERLAATCFKGDNRAPKDTESEKKLLSLGISKEKIAFLLNDNFWGPAGKTGPCGTNTEIFYWKPDKIPVPKTFDPEDERWVELGNNVLMEYNKDKKENYTKLKQKNIDFGGGVERIIASLNNLNDNYLTECFLPIIQAIEKFSKKNYKGNEKPMRIIADHLKASIFILAEGITPSNQEKGYVLRRLLRRAIRYGNQLQIKNFTAKISEPIFQIYNDYESLIKNKEKILIELKKEEEKFSKTLEKGINKFKKIIKEKDKISGKESFLLFQSYGFPIEVTKELAKENKIKINEKEFEKEFEKHKNLSKTTSAGKFKSGLADNSEQTTKLHTAAHLLLAALREVLKNKNITQKGSNITPERLRFDFSFDRKLTEEEIKEIETVVNKQIIKEVKVVKEEMSLEQAKKQGATGNFEEKYGDIISIYTVGNFSKEICAGPHVKNTSELGKFKIKKQESSSAGVRRIKAILE